MKPKEIQNLLSLSIALRAFSSILGLIAGYHFVTADDK
jgi:hypothetical protein